MGLINRLTMTLLEAIHARHSVRHYKNQPLSGEVAAALQERIEEVNEKGRLHIQLIRNEPRAFQGIFAYGKFSGVTDYFVVCGRKATDLDERVGYYGEQLVLFAQQLGLNTCWVGLSYHKVPDTYVLHPGEKVACYISVGYGTTQGADHRRKTFQEVSNADAGTPDWFRQGVEAALLAPTAINQQKFRFDYLPAGGKGPDRVKADKGFSFVGYTKMDLGIAKLHFEIGAGKENFEWA